VGRRRHSDASEQTTWAPLADTMTLVACVFLVALIVVAVKLNTMPADLKKAGKAIDKLRDDLVSAEQNARRAQGTLAVCMEERQTCKSELADRIQEERNGRAGRDALANQAYEAFSKELESVPKVQFQRGLRKLVVSEGEWFDTGSEELRPEAKKQVSNELARAVAVALAKNQHINVIVSGHTDSKPFRSDPFGNWHLSARRATNVVAHLLRSNDSIKPERIFALGFADTRPLPGLSRDDEKNRRVEFMVKYGSSLNEDTDEP